MNLTKIESNEPINVTPMSAQEARECVATIKHNLESLGAMLLDLDRRRGWEALGYASFRECAVTEFGKSQGYVYKLLHAALVDENLAGSEICPLDKFEIALILTSSKKDTYRGIEQRFLVDYRQVVIYYLEVKDILLKLRKKTLENNIIPTKSVCNRLKAELLPDHIQINQAS